MIETKKITLGNTTIDAICYDINIYTPGYMVIFYLYGDEISCIETEYNFNIAQTVTPHCSLSPICKISAASYDTIHTYSDLVFEYNDYGLIRKDYIGINTHIVNNIKTRPRTCQPPTV